MNNKPNFNLLDEFNKQTEQGREKALKLRTRADQAVEKLAAAKLEYEKLVEDSIDLEGEEEEQALAKIDKLAEEIDKLQALHTRRKAEYAAHGRITTKLTREEVRKAFSNKYQKQYQTEVTLPILEHIAELKVQLVAAMQELEDANRYYESLKSEVWGTVGQDVVFDVFGKAYPQGVESYLVTSETLHELDLHRIPQGVDKDAVEKARKNLQNKLEKGRK